MNPGVRGSILLLLAGMLAGCQAFSLAPKAAPVDTYRRHSSAAAITPDGRLIAAVNPDSNSLSLVNVHTWELEAEIKVGQDPRTVSLSLDGRWAFSANRAGGTVSIVDLRRKEMIDEISACFLPWGVVGAPDGRRLYVACEGDDALVIIDRMRRQVVGRLALPERPTGLAINAAGDRLYVTHLLQGSISVIDLDRLQLLDQLLTWSDASLAQSIFLHESAGRAYLPLTRVNNANQDLTFDTTLAPLVAAVDLSEQIILPRASIALPESDQPVGLPFDCALDAERSLLYVVNAASNDLSVIDLTTTLGVAHIEVEDNPRAVVLSPDGAYAFVNNTLAGSLSVIDTRRQEVVKTIALTTIPMPPTLLRGKQLFHSSDSPLLAQEQWMSCNSCHWEGEQDGRTWQFSFAGPRNTTSLLGMVKTYPLRWSGEWDESADLEFAIIDEQFGEGFLGEARHPTLEAPNAGRSIDLDSLAAFIDSLVYIADPHSRLIAADEAARGRALFFDDQIGCAECHPPPYYTDLQSHDVGTGDGPLERLGPAFDTPTLLGMRRSAPYLHDGGAATLLEVLTSANLGDEHGVTSHLTPGELRALVLFMLSLEE